jgi:hypothetical protein
MVRGNFSRNGRFWPIIWNACTTGRQHCNVQFSAENADLDTARSLEIFQKVKFTGENERGKYQNPQLQVAGKSIFKKKSWSNRICALKCS